MGFCININLKCVNDKKKTNSSYSFYQIGLLYSPKLLFKRIKGRSKYTRIPMSKWNSQKCWRISETHIFIQKNIKNVSFQPIFNFQLRFCLLLKARDVANLLNKFLF